MHLCVGYLQFVMLVYVVFLHYINKLFLINIKKHCFNEKEEEDIWEKYCSSRHSCNNENLFTWGIESRCAHILQV